MPALTLVLPPLCQLNTPYPSTAYLARFLRARGLEPAQRDLGLELALTVYSRAGLSAIFDHLEGEDDLPGPAWRALSLRRAYEGAIDPVVAFLQGHDRGFAPRILDPDFLPRGPRSAAVDLRDFGPAAVDDAARHVATRWLSDIADLVTSCVDDGFALARYHHHLAVGPTAFAPIAARLEKTTLVDAWLDALADSITTPLVGLSVPFPGNLYGALRIGKRLRDRGQTVLMGGGYVNTELREVNEPALWEHVDALTYDDGEGPLLAWLEHAEGGPDRRHRTRTREGMFNAGFPDIGTTHAAWYGELPLRRYLNLVDSTNPAHRLWSDGRWNKITLAHGCYWKRCSFCDVNLDYIARFVPAKVASLVDDTLELCRVTGQRGVHVVDEAAPPKAMRDFAIELLARGETLSWWGNIRFERTFTPDLCRLLAAAGCIAVTGGLEVASDRLLAKMEKGVTIEQVAQAAQAFSNAGVLVHAYLMYGFPTETEQETIDSLEVVRQLFAAGALKSAFWHRFVLTRHSAIYPDPGAFGVTLEPTGPSFAANDVPHLDPMGANHDRFDEPLVAALEAYKGGRGFDRAVHTWFSESTPRTTVPPDRIAKALRQDAQPFAGRLVWLGGDPLLDDDGLVLHGNAGPTTLRGPQPALDWVGDLLSAARPGEVALTWETAASTAPRGVERLLPMLRRAGLVAV
ncbi:radical SAM protein [Deltaproteobacteria bacterium]|nr:radical SAM protein [Deltaproteobacteria bacterium]